MIFFVFYLHYLSNDTHIDTFQAFFWVFRNFLELTGNDVIIPGNVVIFGGAPTQIICIVLRNICAKFGAFSTICTISLTFNTIQ